LGVAYESGKYNVNVLPAPGMLISRISPPKRRASSRLIAKPRPVPPYLRLVVPSAWVNGSKMMRCLSVGMPLPELVRLIELELRLDIELAANDTRGPARIASAQLRAFVDELHAFLAADETGSLSSLLAWLDHAEQLDEFAPRTEPPEEDVVQLLTIHGSKGLEWDAVAVVRLVKDELPSAPRDTKGWLGFGVLPYAFRGDARWLPALGWEREVAPTQQDLKEALEGQDVVLPPLAKGDRTNVAQSEAVGHTTKPLARFRSSA